MKHVIRIAATFLLCMIPLAATAADRTTDEILSDLRKQAHEGWASAQYELSLKLSQMEDKGGEALDWMQKAAEQGLADAEYTVGVLYEEGRAGYERNLAKASEWFDKSARQGYKQAQSAIGSLYWNRAEMTKDDRATACAWFMLARDEAGIAECDRTLDPEQKQLAESTFEELKKTYPY